MAHMLARLRNVPLAAIKHQLEADAPQHALDGLFLEHLWQNADDNNEVLFLFRVNDLGQARTLIERLHGEARKQDPNAKLPQMTFLQESEELVPTTSHARR
ncbi:MAG TPA: hypothetical protein VG454_12170 [Gemmatimonadales bacterium]|nr:hypothetical protein [Gemmatimonadales bacterium]